MSSILVVEREPQDQERIQAALRSEGWKVRVFAAADQAMQSAAAESPDLVVVSADVPGGDAVASSFSRNAGGPGVVGLVPPLTDGSGASALEADDLIAKPFSDDELRQAVRRGLDAKRRAAADSLFEAPTTQKLTSQDIFGDVLAEMEEEMPAASFQPPPRSTPFRPPVAAATPAPAAVAASPAPAAPPPAPRPAVSADDDVQRKLEQTLSGVFGPDPRARPASAPAAPAPTSPAAAAAAPVAAPPAASQAASQAASPATPRKPTSTGADVDALLSKTLSNLDLGSRTPRPAAPPAAAPASVAPANVAATQPIPVQPRPAPPGPPVAAPAEARKGRPVGDFDFSELEELARPGRRPEPERPAAPSAVPATPGPVAATVAVPIPQEPVQPPAVDDSPFDLDLAPELPEPPPFEVEEVEEVEEAAVPAPAPVAASAAAPPPAAVPEPAHRDVRGFDGAATQWIPLAPTSPREDGEAGQTFGQYTLLERIAVGGMAEVWKARMRGVEGFQKTVAIKKILAHMTDNSEFIEMFVDEAKLAAQLSHPNIVHIYDLGKINRDYYIAMEYVEGKDLRSLLNAARRKNLPLPVGLALLIAARLAGALDYAHRKRDFEGDEMNLVHRDVSPQNVLLAYEGDVKLCDFGIAKAVSKASHTQMGALKGKLQYMSPEQAWGRVVDSRSDIFSLGAVLFEMLTGERLFTGETEMSVLEAVRQARIRLPRQIDPTLPAEVDEIASRALAVEPQNRFASAGEMQQRLESLMRSLSPPPTHSDLAAYLQRVLAPEPERAEPAAVSFVPAPPPVSPVPAASPAPVSATLPVSVASVASVASAASLPSALPTLPVRIPDEVPAPVSSGAAMPASESDAIVFPHPYSGGPEQEPEGSVQPVSPLGDVPVDAADGSRRSRGLLYAAIVILVLAAILTFIFLSRRGDQPGQPGQDTPAPAEETPTAQPRQQRAPAATGPAAASSGTAPVPAPAAKTPAPPPAQPTLTEAEMKAIVDQEVARREAERRRDLDARVRQLSKELERTKAAAAKSAAQAPPPEASPAPERAEPEPPPV